jgi:hypothetical protein
MKLRYALFLLLLCAAIPAFAVRDGGEKATVYAMRKLPCSQVLPQMTGYPAMPRGADDHECVEYELHTAKVTYIIVPRREVLLLVGSEVNIRMASSELLVHTQDSAKDIRCSVVSMSLRSESEQRQSSASCYSESGRPIACPVSMR